MSVLDVCNQLIHHYWISTFAEGRQEFTSVFVFSDYKRHTCAFKFQLDSLIDLFSAFSAESSAVCGCRFVWNEKRQDYVMEGALGPNGGREVVEVINGRTIAAPDPGECVV